MEQKRDNVKTPKRELKPMVREELWETVRRLQDPVKCEATGFCRIRKSTPQNWRSHWIRVRLYPSGPEEEPLS